MVNFLFPSNNSIDIIGDTAKAAEATAKAGMVFIDPSTNNTMTGYETECVENLEKAVNLYVPLCLNPRANSASTLETGGDADVLNPGAAEHLVVTSAYGGKNLTQIMFQFILMGEMGSALYAGKLYDVFPLGHRGNMFSCFQNV